MYVFWAVFGWSKTATPSLTNGSYGTFVTSDAIRFLYYSRTHEVVEATNPWILLRAPPAGKETLPVVSPRRKYCGRRRGMRPEAVMQ